MFSCFKVHIHVKDVLLYHECMHDRYNSLHDLNLKLNTTAVVALNGQFLYKATSDIVVI